MSCTAVSSNRPTTTTPLSTYRTTDDRNFNEVDHICNVAPHACFSSCFQYEHEVPVLSMTGEATCGNYLCVPLRMERLAKVLNLNVSTNINHLT